MLRCCAFSCKSTHASCYAAVRSLALPHIRNALGKKKAHCYVLDRHWTGFGQTMGLGKKSKSKAVVHTQKFQTRLSKTLAVLVGCCGAQSHHRQGPQQSWPRQQNPNSVGEWEFNAPKTSNNSNETKIDEVRRIRRCSSRKWLRQKKQLYVKNLIPEVDAKTSKRMAQDHQRKDMDKTSKRMAQDLESPRSTEELPNMQRECRAASKSDSKGLLGRTLDSARYTKTRQDRRNTTASDASNAPDGFARHLAQSRRFDTRMQDTRHLDGIHKKYGTPGKTEETRHDRTVIPALDASNASEVKTVEDNA